MVSSAARDRVSVLDHIEAVHLVRIFWLVGRAVLGELRHRVIGNRVQTKEVTVQRENRLRLV